MRPESDSGDLLIVLLVVVMIGLVIAVIRDRSSGAARRDARQRRARELERADREVAREAEKALPRAKVISRDD